MSHQTQHYYTSHSSSRATENSRCNNDHDILDSPDKTYSSLKWREQINNNRSASPLNITSVKENCTRTKQEGGLGPELIKLIKKATHEKKVVKGKRKPLGNVSNGSKVLQSRAQAKKELEEIHSKLSELC